MQKELIKSPINYTGNKYRIISQIAQQIPDTSRVFVDLFCGGATIGFNANAEKIILIDNNPKIISLLKTLAEKDFEKIIREIEKIISEYKLSYSYKYTYSYYRKSGFVNGNNGLKKYNVEGFYRLRTDYNNQKNKNSFKANIMLYMLMVYGFNNDIRFNSKGMYNLPVGKTDFNKNNYEKLRKYNNRAKKINYEFLCRDFRSNDVFNVLCDADFVYCDPPYLITKAVYNENGGWSETDEKDLLLLLSKLDSMGVSFGLSNVIKKTTAKNQILSDWINSNNFKIMNINYHYKSASYNKINRNAKEEEVYITNAD